MKVDRRYRMYGVENANYCMSMMKDEYNLTEELIVEHYGRPRMCFFILHQSPENRTAASWYYEVEDDVVTVYFPNKEDLTRVDEFKTFATLSNV